VQHYLDALPGAEEIIGSFAELAVAKGVRRLVHLSGRNEPEAEQAAQAVRDTGAEVTTLRSTWFSQNFSESYFLDGLLAGELALPAANTPEPFVDADDIADVAVAALTDDGHVGEVYELTGPRLLTFSDAVGEIAQATGREIRYVPVSVEDFATGLDEQGVPSEWIELLVYLFQEVLDGRNAHLADGVQRALGREPRDFSEYAQAAAATGVWSPELRSAEWGEAEAARLQRQPRTYEVFAASELGESFVVPAAPEQALHVFHHPYAYARTLPAHNAGARLVFEQ
jgi:uncharacterized protein YbjT (DUF2867 family)